MKFIYGLGYGVWNIKFKVFIILVEDNLLVVEEGNGCREILYKWILDYVINCWFDVCLCGVFL